MKSIILAYAILVLSLLTGHTAAAEHGANHGGRDHKNSGASVVSPHADVVKHKACPHCGMDRDKFAHSRMLITYNDATTVGVCSLHCTATELKASRGKSIKSVEVADLDSKKLVAADKAFWVIGGSRKGVMTRTAKWAFAAKAAADEFMKKQGGKAAEYKEALMLAEKE